MLASKRWLSQRKGHAMIYLCIRVMLGHNDTICLLTLSLSVGGYIPAALAVSLWGAKPGDQLIGDGNRDTPLIALPYLFYEVADIPSNLV